MRDSQHLFRPFTISDIEDQCARSVSHIGCFLARQSQTYIVFRQQNGADTLPDFRLEFLHPKQLRQGKPGERGIAGQLD